MLAGATSALGPKGRKANRVGFSGIAAVQHALAAPLPQVNAAMKWNVDPPAKDKPKSFKWNPDARPRTNAPKTRYPPPPQASYTPVTIPSMSDQLKVYEACFQVADQKLPGEVCEDPLPLLAGVMAVLANTEESAEQPGVP